MKLVLTVISFCLIAAAFGILIIGAYMDKGQLWLNLFATFFTLGALAFWGWLALENKRDEKPWKNKGRTIIK